MDMSVRFGLSSLSVRLHDSNTAKMQVIRRWLGAALLCVLALLPAGERQAAAQTAHYVGIVSTVGSGFGDPSGVAVDANGNVFVADYATNLVEEIVAGTGGAAAGTVNSSSTVIQVGSGFSRPEGVAVDAHGNVFVADSGNNRVKEIVAGTNGAATGTVNASSQVIQVGATFTNSHGVAVDASGDVFVTSYDDNCLYEIVAGTGGAAAGTVNSSSTVNPINSSSFYNPSGVAVDANGNVFVADYMNNDIKEVVATAGIVNSNSQVNQVGGVFNLPTGVAVDANGNVFVSELNGNAVKEIVAGTGGAATGAVNSSSTVKTFGNGYPEASAVAVDAKGNIFVSESTWSNPAVMEIQPGTVNFGSVNVGVATPPTQTLTFLFDTSGTINAPAVLTQGATGKDFTDAGTGTCTTNGTNSYAVGDSCTVVVNFVPKAPGTRYGAAELLDSSGGVIATAYLTGAGTGPMVNFSPGVVSTLAVSTGNFNFPIGVAVDGSGNIFVADYNNNAVKEILAAGGYTTVNTLANGSFSGPAGVAVDGSGNVFVADSSHNAVKEILAAGGYTTVNTLPVPNGSFNHPTGVAVDGSGNVFVGDQSNNAVKEILAAGGYTTVNTLANGNFSGPMGVAVDGSGNVFVADRIHNAVKEILAAGGYTTVNTLANGNFSTPYGVAVDGSGNVFVADSGHSAVKEILAVGGYTTVNTLATGNFSGPDGVAVDRSGNVFVGDSSHNAVKKIDFADAPSLSFLSTAAGATSSDSPQTVTVTNNGNATLTFSGLSFPTDFSLDGTGASVCTSSTALAAGANCTLPIGFTPQTVGAKSGELLTLTDNNLNVVSTTQSISLSGTATAPPATQLAFTTPPTANIAVGGNAGSAIAISEEDASGNLVTSSTDSITLTVTGPGSYSQTSTVAAVAGVATFNLSSIALTKAGSYTYTATASGLTTATATETVVGTSFTAPNTSTGTLSGVQTATIFFSSTVTLNSTLATAIQVLTQGAPNLDFAYTGGTCAAGTTYTSGQSCTVNYTFTPKYPGQRLGAIVLYDNSATPANVATTYLSGIGTGPLVTFPSKTTTTTLSNGFYLPSGVAIDGYGDVFVADTRNNLVKEIPAGCTNSSCVTTLGGGFGEPMGVAVDGAGNVYVADHDHSSVKEMSAACTSSSCVTPLGGGFLNPMGVAVDGAGNVYVADTGFNVVKEIPAGCTSSSCVTPLGGGFLNPMGVAVDGAGNVYVADHDHNLVEEIPAGCVSSSCVTTLGGGFHLPSGVAVDSAGNVYVADFYNNAVKEIPAGCASSSCVSTLGVGFSQPYGVAVDGAGNLFVADYGSEAVKKIPLATPPSLSFGSISDGQTSSAQVVTVANSGNATLTFPIPTTGNDPSIANYFTLGTGGSACPVLTTSSSAAATLAAGATCTLTTSFAPTGTTSGTVNGSLILTDNHLNVAGSTQTISLSGTATLANPIATQAVASTTLSVNQTASFTPVTGSGGTAALTYSVSPALPTGLSLSSTTGTISGTASVVSSAQIYTVTITDANSLTGTANFSLTVNPLAPTLGVTALPVSPSTVNTAVTFTARLTGTDLSPVAPTGTVSFKINGSASSDCPARPVNASGWATCTTGKLPAGANQTVTATYAGDSNFVVASPGTAAQTVTALAATLGLTASPSSSTAVGDTVTFTAQLAGGALAPVVPSGKVNFTANGTTITGCEAVSIDATGKATCTTSTLAAGSDPITATYSGDSNFTVASAGTATQTVTASTTTTAAAASLSYSASAQTVALSATVVSGTGAVNAGTVTFSIFNGTTQVGTSVTSGTVTNGAVSATFTLPAATAANTYSIHVVYNASTPFATSSDSTHSLTIGKATASAITLGSLAQTYTGSPLAATATTTPSSLAVTYSYVGTGGTSYGPSATAPTAAGSYTVTASINDSNYQGSTTGTLTITKATTATALTTSANPAILADSITLTATVTSATGSPSGTVSFMDSSSATPLGQVKISGGIATYSTALLAAGSHTITAIYNGDGNFNESISYALAQSIQDFSVNSGTSTGGGSGTGGTGGGSSAGTGGAQASQTVMPGDTVNYPLSVTPTAGTLFPVPVTLSISGMPPGATAAITPSTWNQLTATSWSFPANTPLSAITLSIQTPQITAQAGSLSRSLAPFSLALLLLPFAGRWRRAGGRLGKAISLLLLLMIGATAMTTLIGCGSSNGFLVQPPKTYTITATVSAGTVSHSTDLTLTVQ